jgi:hypothetical protein
MKQNINIPEQIIPPVVKSKDVIRYCFEENSKEIKVFIMDNTLTEDFHKPIPDDFNITKTLNIRDVFNAMGSGKKQIKLFFKTICSLSLDVSIGDIIGEIFNEDPE